MTRRPTMTARIRRICVLISTSILVWQSGVVSAGADMVPHQAIYKMTLSKNSPASQFNGLSGAAVSQIERTCEGWVINEQILMTMLTVNGGAIEREMTFKARESLDGSSYVFDSLSITNGNTERFSGTARRKQGGAAEAEFVTPRPFEMPLPDGTRFYISMTHWLLELAGSGKRAAESYAFDGTDDEGPQKVSAFILPDSIGGAGLSGDSSLLDRKAWQVRLAFFKTGKQVTEPEYEISLRLLDNGVVTHFELIFNDLVVDQILQDVLPAKDERCG